MPKPCLPYHPGPVPGCRVCWLAANDARYARKWGLPTDGMPASSAPSKAKAAPCRFEGDDLTGPEREAAGLPHGRRWLHCLHADKPLGPHVCGCRGCGAMCPGYRTPEEPDAPTPRPTQPGAAGAAGSAAVRVVAPG